MRRLLHGFAALAVAVGLAACSFEGQPGTDSSTEPSVGPVPSTPSPASSSPAATIESPPPVSETSEMTITPSATSGSSFILTSTAFGDGGQIPREFSCDGANVSPPFAWTGVPADAEAIVLVVDDPDARNFVHWIVLDLPGSDGELPKGVLPTAAVPQQGRNDFDRVGWGGPCPPSGTHRYRFTLSALGAPLGLAGHPGGDPVRKALMRSTVLGQTTLTATYRRP